MNSVGDKCNALKKEYDACFNAWFSNEFLKGNYNDEVCKDLFKTYTDCVKAAIKEQKIDLHEIEKDQLSTEEEKKSPGEGS